MKKRLICLLLILVVALTFAACNTPDNNNDGNREPNEESKYVASDMGEKGYIDYVFSGMDANPNGQGSYQVLITSLNELQEFRSTVQIPYVRTSYIDSNTERISMGSRLDVYGSKYFEESNLVVMLWKASSGHYDFTVKNVNFEGNTLNVTILRWDYLMGHCALMQWGAIIECEKGDFETLSVDTETTVQQMRPNGEGLYFGFTNEATLETIFRNYTAEDFAELDFDFTIKEYFVSSRDQIRNALLEGQIDASMQEYMQRFTRVFVITLTTPNNENVLRAMELLSQREEIEWVEPKGEGYFEID